MRASILEGAARALFVSWYADAVDAGEHDGDAAGPGQDWMDVAPATPDSARNEAMALLRCVEGDNRSWSEVLARPEVEADPEGFGHYLAMEALGHGVSWADDHDDHGLLLPLICYMGPYVGEGV
jgi:hypothetical protein